ncbi:E3 ubiquitin-protein ligase RGLG2-like isoform X2 [Magnolia sinica]|uniref:E3 ubiquitin-protein ligase RGLG2-like isoform X2 n=1 Tax=Magnolia sinica TaxID=86752 RepID=UPI0026598B3B|nr:E3 ubiquitin-protein ligase RGLG2-like isoform X2 [Magnolia sinica]
MGGNSSKMKSLSHVINHIKSKVPSRSHSKYSRIANYYESHEQVTAALANAGLECANLIVGIDFTKSNEWTASTNDQQVFSFFQDGRSCNGFKEALDRYREIVPHLKLSGPTSFAPIIETAIGIVEKSNGRYHVLLIIADGQVTRSVDTCHGEISPQEKDTIDAIVKASNYPLSIVLVGVGDGPWDMMRQFDDNIPARAFDNFQFVNFTEIMGRNIPSCKETAFALEALMEIPSQYKATMELKLLGCPKGTPVRDPLPPPREISQLDNQICEASENDTSSPTKRNQESIPLKSTRKSPAKMRRTTRKSKENVRTNNTLPGVGSRRRRDLEDSMTNTHDTLIPSPKGENADYQSSAGNDNISANKKITASSRKKRRTGL